ncbi:dienelactone hydrolase family protein [Shewanella submarina]|uniref:Dienelactone hydrolase family protein n=1 Tax=Shewanella submarina TaxID=2016376 RepID=A0ABV7GG60_9GAMM|nr:dienelactone hydrolase family protein [Shewanella submarina]MCL1037597.1 dienelactone hydrolase family protein [Shewanella submarina]
MKRILVTDIFGRTPELEAFAEKLTGEHAQVQIIDPYAGIYRQFMNEAQAYGAFSSEVGMEGYIALLQAELMSCGDDKISLVGFSAGAAAIWALSEHKVMGKVSGAVLFYGGQIRHYSRINPVVPTHCIFPALESHFSVEELMLKLEGKTNLTLQQVPFLHGFMNPLSAHFSQPGFELFSNRLFEVREDECLVNAIWPAFDGSLGC